MSENVEKLHTHVRAMYHQFLNNRKTQRLVAVACACIVLLGIVLYFILPPTNFPTNSMVMLPEGASAPVIAQTLVREHVIDHPDIFLVLARVTHLDTSLTGGAYVFPRPINLLNVLVRVGNGEHGITQARITFTEGMTVKDMTEVLSKNLSGFDAKKFMNIASTSEGYLFPDTYFVLPNTSKQDLIQRFKSQFDRAFEGITPEGQAKKSSEREIVILASILEREARGEEDMKMVSGILYNRLTLGMPLQVDAVFGYIHGKNGYTPTRTDLESDSPYNTYRNKGLPPTPIDNPGLEALTAAAQPTKNPYLYYLTGRDGAMHYAKTFEEHKRNRTLYLD